MDPSSPLANSERLEKDSEHIKILSICHYVMAAFSLLGVGFLVVHFFIMDTVLHNPEVQTGKPITEDVWNLMKAVYIASGVCILTIGILNFFSARFLKERKNRVFSLVLAGINCTSIPLGTTLGVFTFVVLSRPSVKWSYDKSRRNR